MVGFGVLLGLVGAGWVMTMSRDRTDSTANRVVAVCGSGGSLCLGKGSVKVGIPERLRVSTHIGVITETIVSGIH